MALLTSEIARVKSELGYSVMGIQALPYIGFTPIFDSVIQAYLTAGATTTSATAVTAAASALAPVNVTLTLASGTGFNAGDRIVIDVDQHQETAVVVDKPSANTVVVGLFKAHSGAYAVTVEGGESIIREKLQILRVLKSPNGSMLGGLLMSATETAGIKKVDEVEFFGGSGMLSEGQSSLSQVLQMIEYYRDELASDLGVERKNRRGGGGSCEMY